MNLSKGKQEILKIQRTETYYIKWLRLRSATAACILLTFSPTRSSLSKSQIIIMHTIHASNVFHRPGVLIGVGVLAVRAILLAALVAKGFNASVHVYGEIHFFGVLASHYVL